MDKDKVEFLTKKNANTSLIIENLQKSHKNVKNDDDKKILNELLNLISRKNSTFLTPQEIHFLDSNNPRIWSEYLIFRYKMQYFPRNRIVYDFPLYLLIEPVSACNLRCIMCFQIDESFTNSNLMGMMDIKLFKNIIDQAVKGGTKAITLASRGEPTLHPKLGEMLEYCSGKFLN